MMFVYLHKDQVNDDNIWKHTLIYSYSIGQRESNIFHMIEHKIGTKNQPCINDRDKKFTILIP